MSSELKALLQNLSDAEGLVSEIAGKIELSELKSNEKPDLELLQNLLKNTAGEPPALRMIQHLACSGGTIISRCLAALPNVAMLSEISPYNRSKERLPSAFSPTDVLSLAIYGKFAGFEALAEKIFIEDICVTNQHCKSFGQYLLLREHSQSDYLSDEDGSPVHFSRIKHLLSRKYKIYSILTLRHPIDSYLSLLKNKWVKFNPSTFDEYCRRHLLFIEQNKDAVIFKYEDFVNDPETEIQQMSEVLKLPYNADFLDIFEIYELTGGSGRSSLQISARKRRPVSADFIAEAEASKHYQQLCSLLKYERALVGNQ